MWADHVKLGGPEGLCPTASQIFTYSTTLLPSPYPKICRFTKCTGCVCDPRMPYIILLQTVKRVYAVHKPQDLPLYKMYRVCMRPTYPMIYSFTDSKESVCGPQTPRFTALQNVLDVYVAHVSHDLSFYRQYRECMRSTNPTIYRFTKCTGCVCGPRIP